MQFSTKFLSLCSLILPTLLVVNGKKEKACAPMYGDNVNLKTWTWVATLKVDPTSNPQGLRIGGTGKVNNIEVQFDGVIGTWTGIYNEINPPQPFHATKD